MLLAESALQRRDKAALLQCAAQLEALARRDDHRLYLAIAQRAWGVAYHLAGELEEAEMRLNQALESFAGMEARWQAGLTFYELGELAGTRGDRSGARRNFEKALEAFEALGARPSIERARRALDGQGWLPSSPAISSLN
jgi:hypothetical protein